MNNPFSISALTRNKSAETQMLALLPAEIKEDYSEKKLSHLNPFSLPTNDLDLYLQREKERAGEKEYYKAIKGIHIKDRYTYNQPHSVLSEIRKEVTDSEGFLPAVGSRRNLSSKKETIKEFIQRKREILLVKKNIENKKLKYNELEENILRKDEECKSDMKKLEDNKGRVNKYEEQLKADADMKAKEAEDRVQERSEKQKELKNLQDEIEFLKAKKDRRNDELKSLEDYKQFVDELIPNDNKISIFLTENLISLEIMAKKLEEGINSLETTNLFQIQQAQEDEQELEMLKHKNFSILAAEKKKFTEMQNTVGNLKAQQALLEEKLRKISNAEETEAPVDESSSKKILNELNLLYSECGGDLTNNPKELEMLEFIEKAFDVCLKDKEKKNKESLKKKEREIDRERRAKKIEFERINNVERSKAISEKMEKRKQKVAKKIGRKDMKRSKLHEKVEVEKPPDEPQEVLDRREFLEMEN